jgi:antitoxin component of RelBE/YafQ-DinJ toxin-antitoxin module
MAWGNSFVVELPDALRAQAEAVANTQGIDLSDVVRAALERYLLRSELQQLSALGSSRASAAGLREDDVERLIREQRATEDR